MELSGQICDAAGMFKLRLTLLLALTAPAAATPPPSPLPEPGVYTNEEAVYFAGENGASPKPAWSGLEIGRDARWQWVDAFGKPLSEWQSGSVPGLARGDDKWLLNGLELRRGAAFKCWLSLRRFADKPDGSPDYSFHPGLKLHDQGGRAAASDPGAPAVVIRLRQVIWPPPSTNKPSLVLYVHKPEEPDKAVSYVWADPQANLIGINLRWVQGSCSRESAAP
jgi:hypothetical protein